jgi:hypothetical protein
MNANAILDASVLDFCAKLSAKPRVAILAEPEPTEADYAKVRAARKRARRITWAELAAVDVDLVGIHRRARQLREACGCYARAYAAAWMEAARAARACHKPGWDFLYPTPTADEIKAMGQDMQEEYDRFAKRLA